MTTTIKFSKEYHIWKMPRHISDSDNFYVLVDSIGYIVYSDGFMLAAIPCEITCPDEEKDISYSISKKLIKFAASVKESDVILYIENNQIYSEIENLTMREDLPDTKTNRLYNK